MILIKKLHLYLGDNATSQVQKPEIHKPDSNISNPGNLRKPVTGNV